MTVTPQGGNRIRLTTLRRPNSVRERSPYMIAAEHIARAARWVLLGLAVALAAVFAGLALRLPASTPTKPAEAPAPAWPSAARIPPEDWGVVQRGADASLSQGGPLARRFRLAGTFFQFGDAGDRTESRRRAILDDLQKSQQYLVSEGDIVEDYEVTRVFPERILLRSGGVEYELALSFATAAAKPAAGAAPPEAGTSLADQPALETSRFGKRVAENRWVFSREELLKYYREVLDDPERIAALYISLKPDYQDDEIGGYVLDEEGEADFFQAVGLKDGDVVRRVNSMRMVSQRRAEYFIGEFLKNRVNALVLDIEREGKPEKLIYLIR